MARGRPAPDDALYPGGIRTPIPDPTFLTTEAVGRATERFDLAIKGLREIIEARLDAMDQAMDRHLEFANGIRDMTERLVGHLQTLHDEKFSSIEAKFEERNVWLHEKFDGLNKQFIERDVRTDQATRAAKDALDAALRSSGELVAQQNAANAAAAAKSEASFVKLIDAMGLRIDTVQKVFDDRSLELKERIDRGEGSQQGERHAITEKRLDAGHWVAIIAMVASVLYVAFVAFGKHP